MPRLRVGLRLLFAAIALALLLPRVASRWAAASKEEVNMLSNEFPEMDARVPQSLGGSPVSIRLYVENADAIFNQAVAAGAKVVAATVLLSHEVQI